MRPNHDRSAVRWLLFDGFMPDRVPFPNIAAHLPHQWKQSVATALLRINPFARQLRALSQLSVVDCPHAYLTLQDSGSTTEIAAIMSYENTSQGEVSPRRLVVRKSNSLNTEMSISTTSRLWEPLVYPLFFPCGTLGWDLPDHLENDLSATSENAVTTQMWYYRARLLREERFSIFGRLTNEYLIDMWSRNLDSRLHYIRTNQQRVLQEDAALMGIPVVENTENIYLPSSFLGSNRWASEQIADSLAIAAQHGAPKLFITMTCNSNWPEIQCMLRPGQTYADIPLVVARVFKRKLTLLLKTLRSMFSNIAGVEYLIYSVEFQKRGLPHAHILIKFKADLTNPVDIDSVISAEMPDDPDDAELVRRFMLHNHPSPDSGRINSYCQRKNSDSTYSCRFGYPQPLQEHTTIDRAGRVHYRRRKPGDERVVPHCLPLLRKFQCHINVEVASSSHLFQYIFKYIHKGLSHSFSLSMKPNTYIIIGPDRARFRLSNGSEESIDEIEEYYSGRCLSAMEAAWRILGFHITSKDPSVTSLPIHLPSSPHHRQYTRRNGTNANSLSLLERYFLRPCGTFALRDGSTQSFDDLTYSQYFSFFRLEKYSHENVNRPRYYLESSSAAGTFQMHAVLRLQQAHITRLQQARPSEGERYYLRALLMNRTARSFTDLLTVDGIQHDVFQDAAVALGLFANENEGDLALQEAITYLKTPRQVRILFVHLLINECIVAPRTSWERFGDFMTFDYTLHCEDMPDIATNGALQEISGYLEEYGKNPSDYGLPQPTCHSDEVLHEQVRWGTQVDHLAHATANAVRLFNPEQQHIFNTVVDAVITHRPLLLFVDGKAGRGKTFLITAICNYLRSQGHIVIPTATAGNAARLYPGGRTTHSAFKVRT